MKQLYLFVLVLFAGNMVLSQQQPLYLISEVKEMAVFPGCEKIKPAKKKEMNECFAQKITELLNGKMDGLDETMAEYGITKALAVIQFVITKEGVMLNFSETRSSNPVLAQYAVNALSQISMEIKPIRPAKLKKDQAVNILYQMPVTWESDDTEEDIAYKFPVDEIVLFTLTDTDAVYEVRFFQDRNIKVYETSSDKEAYLGRFLSISELKRSDPYKTLIENESKAEKTLVTAGMLEDEQYEIYIHNLFQKDKKSKPIFVEVDKVENGQAVPVQTFEKEIEFNKSKFAPLIYR